MKQEIKQAAILARVSTATQNFDRQLVELSSLAEGMGYKVSPEYTYAEKISGFKKVDDRLELTRLLNDIRSGKKIDMIFCAEISRISRDPIIGRDLVDELVTLKVPVYIQNIKMCSLEGNGTRNTMFSIFFQILIEFAYTESEYTKTRVRSGKLQNFKEGRHIGGEHVIFGYMVDKAPDDRKAGKLIPNTSEARLVKEVFEMYNEGHGMKVIANYLNQQDIPTRTGVPWSVGTVNGILKQTTYYGTREYNDKLYESIVPAIIDKATYDLAQANAALRNVAPERNVKYLYLLKNKARCGYCGSLYAAKFRPKKHSHYMCAKRAKGKHCLGCGIGIDKIESISWFMVKSNLGAFTYFQNASDELLKLDKELLLIEAEIESCQLEIEAKNIEKSKWLTLFVKGKTTEEILDKETEKLDKSVNNLHGKIKSKEKAIAAKRELVTKFKASNNILALMGSVGTDRVKINQIIDAVLDKVIITSVTTGTNANEFILSAYMYGQKEIYMSVLFDKTTLTVYPSDKAAQMIKYDETGIGIFDMDKVVREFKKVQKSTGGFRVDLSKKIEHIPFTRLNTLNKMEVV